MKSTFLIISTICTVCFATNFLLKPRIIGGKVAKIRQFQYQASLRYMNNRAHFCGGSILNSRFLLTTAHCIRDESEDRIYAVVGAIRGSINGDIDEDGVAVKLDKIIEHEHFNRPTLENDIALIQTAKEIIFTDKIQSIALPAYNLSKRDSTAALMSGWILQLVLNASRRIFCTMSNYE